MHVFPTAPSPTQTHLIGIEFAIFHLSVANIAVLIKVLIRVYTFKSDKDFLFVFLIRKICSHEYKDSKIVLEEIFFL